MVQMGSNPLFLDLIIYQLMQKTKDLSSLEPWFNHRNKHRPCLQPTHLTFINPRIVVLKLNTKFQRNMWNWLMFVWPRFNTKNTNWSNRPICFHFAPTVNIITRCIRRFHLEAYIIGRETPSGIQILCLLDVFSRFFFFFFFFAIFEIYIRLTSQAFFMSAAMGSLGYWGAVKVWSILWRKKMAEP